MHYAYKNIEIDIATGTAGLICLTLHTRTFWHHLHLLIPDRNGWLWVTEFNPVVWEREWGLGPVFIYCKQRRLCEEPSLSWVSLFSGVLTTLKPVLRRLMTAR